MDGSSTQRCHAIQDRSPRRATAVLIAADFDACAGRQCAPAPRSGPSLPPSGYFPTAVRCYRSFARSGVTALRCESCSVCLTAGECRSLAVEPRLRPGGGLPNPAFRFDRRACFPVPTWQRPSHGAQRRRWEARSHPQPRAAHLLREHGEDGEHRTFSAVSTVAHSPHAGDALRRTPKSTAQRLRQ